MSEYQFHPSQKKIMSSLTSYNPPWHTLRAIVHKGPPVGLPVRPAFGSWRPWSWLQATVGNGSRFLAKKLPEVGIHRINRMLIFFQLIYTGKYVDHWSHAHNILLGEVMELTSHSLVHCRWRVRRVEQTQVEHLLPTTFLPISYA